MPYKVVDDKAVDDKVVNELISAQPSSDSGLQVALHPLPILEISDYITRSSQRGHRGAIVGALLGQQNGREITIEHSFSCKTAKNQDGFYELDFQWFQGRLEQMKLVHKDRSLDLVGWYSLVDKTGPTPLHLPIHQQIIGHNESAILLGIHVFEIGRPAAGDSLPLTIYESNLEADGQPTKSDGDDEDKEMKDPEVHPAKQVLRFRELPYSTEIGEAEMISMQFIREGGANATVNDREKRILEQFERKVAVDDGKGKRRAVTRENTKSTAANPDANLTKDEAEYMSALQAKFNAVKMMKSRVDLVVAYLEKLPPDFVSGRLNTGDAAQVAQSSAGKYTAPSNNILRRINALVTNLGLASSEQRLKDMEKEVLKETNDVKLIALISDILSSAAEIREAGKRFAIVESAKVQRSRQSQTEQNMGMDYPRGAVDML
ncbi:hypothetical protein B0T24DRAFT_586503 [Lasiosphaeria ovina]|uniref:COP9 signalosome complex subunit 6 n=1 Tax=Lasiosphaeria ovina TaxID=92902 RepID=A0AAE0JRV2_9PEZI|nr:hypothetical protein B0T24DRAFT_586503 [Lasiosphaeria ovina]